MTQEQLDNWFVYHAPTAETTPKYEAIRKAQAEASRVIYNSRYDAGVVAYEAINDACKAFAIVIDENAPDSADKTAAIRCVRLARNAANEAVAPPVGSPARAANEEVLSTMAEAELLKARWQACAAIALGGK